MERFDLIVLGAGPGGYTAALEAAGLKKSVLLVEADRLGGTCLNRGCIPTKALLRSAHLYREALECEELGVKVDGAAYDLPAMCRRANAVQDQLRDGIASLLKKGKVEQVTGRGKVLTGHSVEVNGQVYEADHILVATGSVPAMPPIPGLDLPGVVTSDDLLSGEGVNCKSLLVIGGGVVGVEFAQVYSDLGCEVTIVEALPRLLANLDREMGQSLAMSFKKRGVQVFTDSSVKSLAADGGKLACTFADKKGNEQTLAAEKVLVCTGRRPNTKELFTPEVEEALAMERGYIPADGDGRTKVEGIWAAGDLLLGGIQLAHAAEAEARNAVRAMFGEKPVKDISLVPACIFTQPEIASVGMTADQAKAAGIQTGAQKNLSTSNGKALIDGADRGFVKLLYRKEDGVLLGAQLLCPHASEMIGGLTAAIRYGLTLDQVRETIFPHPTVSEVIGI